MLHAGDTVPNFTLPLAHADGKRDPVEFKSLLGQGPVVIAFFPLAFSVPCSKEVCEMRDHVATLGNVKARVVGFSVDTPFTNVAFAKDQGLTFGVFSDPNHKVVGQIWQTGTAGGVEQRAKRGWMLVGKDGKVVEQWISDDPAVWSGFKPIEAALQKVKA